MVSAGRPNVDEAELVKGAQAADLDAFDMLVHRYSDVAFRTAYVIVGSAADAEDVVQDAFFNAYRALSRFRRDAPFRPWLLRIVANEARNRRRGAARRAVVSLSTIDLPGPGAAGDPPAVAESAERQRVLVGAINTLPHEDREVITCRYFLELSVEETAAALDWRQGTVKSRLSRALQRLRDALRATGMEMADV